MRANEDSIATGTILTALEACPCPFQSPEVFHVARKISVRVSSFEEDFLARSISASTLNQESEYEPKDQEPSLKQSIKRKPLPTSPSMGSEISEISEISSAQRPITPLLPMAQKTRARGWGEDWTHLVDDTGSKGLTHSDSAVSGLSRSSSGYLSSGSSELSVSNRGQQPRVVTPSSSISELTKRSPLSTMRYVFLSPTPMCDSNEIADQQSTQTLQSVHHYDTARPISQRHMNGMQQGQLR